jgi:nucleoside-diphosphate-sugar epimerase
MAAFDGCRSKYGAAKRVVEREVIGSGGVVVRPGTVYGGKGGGIVEKIVAVMARIHLAPLIGDGAQALYVVEIDRLAQSICTVVGHMAQFHGKILMAADPERRTLRSFLEALAATRGIRAVMLPLPVPLLYFPLRFLELLGVQPPLRSDSVVSIAEVMPPELVSALEQI